MLDANRQFPDWRDYSPAELDQQYNQATLVPDNTPYRARKSAAAELAHQQLTCYSDVAYGPSLTEKIDIFPAKASGAPIHMFIHGGAWKGGNKRAAAYSAPVFHRAGAVFIAVDFGLVPSVMIEEQIRQCRAAIAWAWRNADTFGGDRDRLYVSGHSSGGHVTGMVAVTDWEGIFGLPADTVKGVAPFSGMFDLEPVRHSWRNGYLGLDEARARALSAIYQIPSAPPKLVLGFGGKELTEFQRQSVAFADAWRTAGHDCTLIELPEHNHFEVGAAFGDESSPVARAVLGQMGL